jgi:hypothetical protein
MKLIHSKNKAGLLEEPPAYHKEGRPAEYNTVF